MERSITVKGTAQAKRSPDLVVLELNLESLDLNYETAMTMAATAVSILKSAVTSAGFSAKDLKTTNFDVQTHYRGETDPKGNYQQIFDGYQVSQGLKLEFAWDQGTLGRVLRAIGESRANPRLNIRFTLADPQSVQAELLQSAAANARHKAEVLAAAARVRLGELLRIDYNWSDIHLYSQTNYAMEDRLMAKSLAAPEMEPADITFSDSASFVWTIGD